MNVFRKRHSGYWSELHGSDARDQYRRHHSHPLLYSSAFSSFSSLHLLSLLSGYLPLNYSLDNIHYLTFIPFFLLLLDDDDRNLIRFTWDIVILCLSLTIVSGVCRFCDERFLFVVDNEIGHYGAKKLSEALKKNTTLTSLDLFRTSLPFLFTCYRFIVHHWSFTICRGAPLSFILLASLRLISEAIVFCKKH